MTTTPTAAAQVSGTIKALARSFHDGPLGASEHAFDETSEQGKWCIEVASFFLAEIQPDPEPDHNASGGNMIQPEPQPVAWYLTDIQGRASQATDRPSDAEAWREQGLVVTPLYATPSSAGTVSVEAAARVLLAARNPDGMTVMPEYVRDMLRALAGEGGR